MRSRASHSPPAAAALCTLAPWLPPGSVRTRTGGSGKRGVTLNRSTPDPAPPVLWGRAGAPPIAAARRGFWLGTAAPNDLACPRGMHTKHKFCITRGTLRRQAPCLNSTGLALRVTRPSRRFCRAQRVSPATFCGALGGAILHARRKKRGRPPAPATKFGCFVWKPRLNAA